MIAVLPEHLVHSGDDAAVEGGGHIRNQDADAAAVGGFQLPGKGIGTIVQIRDGSGNGLRVFQADIAAV